MILHFMDGLFIISGMFLFVERSKTFKLDGGVRLQNATDNLGELVLVFSLYQKVAFPIDFYVFSISGPR